MPLSQSENRFLEAFRASLTGRTVSWETVPAEGWQDLIQTANAQKVLPLILEAVYTCPAAASADLLIRQCKKQSIHYVMHQAQKSAQFLMLYRYLQKSGIHPLVVKGILCRHLYHQHKDHRGSADEDILVRDEEFAACCQALLDYGMVKTDETADISAAAEISFQKKDSGFYIELHRRLFAENSAAADELESLFSGIYDYTVSYEIDAPVTIESLSPHDHMLYLLLHAYKHFIHSGFGIRQICDIALWGRAYADRIDWKRLLKQCERIHTTLFASAVFRIAEQYLELPLPLPDFWRKKEIDPEPMLHDLLSGGIYGATDKTHIHAGTVTLHAVEARSKQSKDGLLTTLFPAKKQMISRYPYLKKYPVLLPAAWASRFWQYGTELLSSHGHSSAVESLQTAKARVALLRYYGIIE